MPNKQTKLKELRQAIKGMESRRMLLRYGRSLPFKQRLTYYRQLMGRGNTPTFKGEQGAAIVAVHSELVYKSGQRLAFTIGACRYELAPCYCQALRFYSRVKRMASDRFK